MEGEHIRTLCNPQDFSNLLLCVAEEHTSSSTLHRRRRKGFRLLFSSRHLPKLSKYSAPELEREVRCRQSPVLFLVMTTITTLVLEMRSRGPNFSKGTLVVTGLFTLIGLALVPTVIHPKFNPEYYRKCSHPFSTTVLSLSLTLMLQVNGRDG